jgi:predicted XRE-type DNA-binding protein
MNKTKIVVTLSHAVQIGENEFKQHRISRVFAVSRSIGDMLSWAEAEGIKNPQISDLMLSEYTGESF